MIKVSDFIMKFIADLGVKHVFILAGGQSMHLVDSLGRNPRLKHVCALHEQAVAMMAEAYSRVTDNFGVAIVTTGPGGTNTLTGVAGAWLDSTPCMFISGQFSVKDTIGTQNIRQTCLQNTDPVALVKPITKYAVMISDARKVKYHLEKALYLARHGRPGPVWLDIPLDIQGTKINEEDLLSFDPREISEIAASSRTKIQVSECVELLKKAKRPVILAGNGIRLAHAKDDFIRLVSRLGIPVLTSINGIDLIYEKHPLYMGRPNYWGQRPANFIIQNSDVLLSIGSGLHLETTGFNYSAFAREAQKIIVDIDRGELSKRTIKPDLAIQMDAKDFVSEMGKQARAFLNPNLPAWLKTCRRWKMKYPIIIPEFFKRTRGVHPFAFVDALSAEAGSGDIIIPGNAGSHFTTCVQAFKVKKGQRVYSEIGIGAMGFSLPSSIAAAVARRKKRVICLTGDGGIQLNIQELQTVMNYNLPIKIFVMNNGGYVSIRNTQKRFFNGHYVGCDRGSGLGLPDLCKIAKAYGLRTSRISGCHELRAKINKVLHAKGPILCEVMLDPAAVLMPKVTSQRTASGQLISSPLEDLWPFLDRDVFKKEMIIRPLD